jgi:hypothetical protein
MSYEVFARVVGDCGEYSEIRGFRGRHSGIGLVRNFRIGAGREGIGVYPGCICLPKYARARG